MTRSYHGKNTLPLIKPNDSEETIILVQTAPKDINFILKIIESYSHLTIPVQLDPAQGLLGFHTPKDQQKLLYSILDNIPRTLKILRN